MGMEVNTSQQPAAAPAAPGTPASAPDISDAIWATHEDLSPTSARFVRYALAHPEAARGVDYRQAEGLPEWMRRYPYRLQPWPIFVDARKLRQVERATVGLTELVKTIPERIFGGDPRRICEFYGTRDEMLMKLMLAPPNGFATSFARGDFVDDGTNFKCLELNVSATIGGWQDRFFDRACRAQPYVASFLAAEGSEVRHRDPWRTALELVVDSGCRQGHDLAGRFNIAVAVNPETAELEGVIAAMSELFQEVLRDRGGRHQGEVVRCTYPDDLTVRSGALFFRDLRISAVIETTSTQTPLGVYRCFKAQRLGLFNGPLSGMLSSKRNLALLSQHEESDLLTAEERQIVRSHVPWSRQVVDERTTYHGESVGLLDFAVARRGSLVLKPVAGYQGIGVHLGCRTSPVEWWQRLADATATGGRMLLQEYVTSRPYLFQHGEQGWAGHQVIWGTFSFGGKYGGGFLRLLPLDSGPGSIS